MSRLNRADVLVALQFLAIAAIVIGPRSRAWQLPGPVAAMALAALAAGLVFSFAGLVALGRDLTVFVAPPQGATLRTTGPYALSRNPIYAGLLVAMAGFANPRWQERRVHHMERLIATAWLQRDAQHFGEE